MKFNGPSDDKAREGAIILLDGAKYLLIAMASALIATIISPSSKKKKKSSDKKKSSFVKRYGTVNKVLSGGAEKVALKWLEEDVRRNPNKYLERDKGIHIDTAEIIDI